jgi:hypothetical protein
MPQATITVRIQTAGRDETFGKTLSEEHTEALINALLRGDDEKLQDEFPNQADRIIALYKRRQIQWHNDLMNAEQRRAQTVTDGWT